MGGKWRAYLKMSLEARGGGEDGVAVGENVCKVVAGEGIGSDIMWWGGGQGVEVYVGDGCEHQGPL